MQSDSTTGAPPDHRSVTDLWRDLSAADAACPLTDFHLHPAEHETYIEAVTEFYERLDEVAALRNQATIRTHAQVEHPDVAWDAQAAVFTTGRFSEGRAR